MKRIFSFVLVVATVFCLSACNSQKSSSIEPTEWVMSTVQSGTDGTVIYCSASEQAQFPEASVKNITCTIDGMDITIKDNEADQEWAGTYTENDVTKERAIYEVTFGEETGQMVNSLTEYEDNTDAKNTLVITCGDYTLYFFAQ